MSEWRVESIVYYIGYSLTDNKSIYVFVNHIFCYGIHDTDYTTYLDSLLSLSLSVD